MPGICADLVRLDDDWQDCRFTQLVEALRKWTERSPKMFVPPDKNLKRDKMYHTRENEHKWRICVYCDEEVAKISDCRLILSQIDCALTAPVLSIGFPNAEVQKHV